MHRERQSSVIVWFVIWIVWDVLLALGYFTGSGLASLFGSNSSGFSSALGVIYLIDIAFFTLILCWQFVGVIGIVVSTVLKVILAFLMLNSMGAAVNSFMGTDYTWINKFGTIIGRVLFLVMFFSVMTKKKDGYSTLDYLVGNYSVVKNVQKDKSTNDYYRCNSCNKTFSSGYSSCPHCAERNFEINPNVSKDDNEDVIVNNLPSVKTSSGDTKKCIKCGQNVDADIFICPKCKGDIFQ